ncbi:hypothetical protein TcBrA4_0040500 [Trypanosoma cruzi]|nr:hypothetical protein TcBrA4_0040500 [Trypanosoma cruzi]
MECCGPLVPAPALFRSVRVRVEWDVVPAFAWATNPQGVHRNGVDAAGSSYSRGRPFRAPVAVLHGKCRENNSEPGSLVVQRRAANGLGLGSALRGGGAISVPSLTLVLAQVAGWRFRWNSRRLRLTREKLTSTAPGSA